MFTGSEPSRRLGLQQKDADVCGGSVGCVLPGDGRWGVSAGQFDLWVRIHQMPALVLSLFSQKHVVNRLRLSA